jgi:hypothetical protein
MSEVNTAFNARQTTSSQRVPAQRDPRSAAPNLLVAPKRKTQLVPAEGRAGKSVDQFFRMASAHADFHEMRLFPRERRKVECPLLTFLSFFSPRLTCPTGHATIPAVSK